MRGRSAWLRLPGRQAARFVSGAVARLPLTLNR
jgi:hypothetical protein